MAQTWPIGTDMPAVDGIHIELQRAPRDMVAIVLDSHLVQAFLCRCVSHCDGTVLVVSDVGTCCFTRGHPDLPCQLPFLHSEWDDQVERPQHGLQRLHRNHGLLCGPVCGAGARPKWGIWLVQLQHFRRLLHMRQRVTCQHMEGAVGNVFTPKADGDDIFARLRCCVVDIKGTIVVLNYIHIELCPVRCGYCAGHLPLACCLGIHCNHSLLSNLDSGTQAGTQSMASNGYCNKALAGIPCRQGVDTEG